MKPRTLVALAVAATLAAVAVAILLRRGAPSDGSTDARSATRAAAPTGSGRPLGSPTTSRAVARAAFADVGDPDDPAASPVDGPVAPHLRRVAIALAYDDGHPIAFAPVRAVLPQGPESGPVDPPWSDEGPWNVAAGARPFGMTDARGVVALILPRSERCALVAGSTGESTETERAFAGPRFRTPEFAVEADEVRLAIPARATRLRLVDVDGAPLAWRRVEASGRCGTTDGNDSAALAADATGVVVFRGFAEGAELLCDVAEDLRFPSGGAPEAETAATASPPARLVGGELRVPTGADVEVRFRRLNVVRARLVDGRGAPAADARMAVVATYPGVGAAPVVAASSGDDGVVYLVVPADGVRMSAVAAPTELRCEFSAFGRVPTTSLPWPAPSAPRFFDYGDVKLPFFETFRLTVLYADGTPCEDAHVSAHYGDVEASREAADAVARSDAEGRATLADERLAGRRGFLVRRGELGVLAPDDPAARATEWPGLIVRLPATSELTYALPEPSNQEHLWASIAWDARGDVGAGGAKASFDARGEARFGFVPAGAVVRARFVDCVGDYATSTTTIPAEGGAVREAAPRPPAVSLRTRVFDADGQEILSYAVEAFGKFGERVYQSDDAGAPPVPRPDGTLPEPCLFARPGDEIDVVASERGRPIASARVRVVAPTTEVALTAAPTRTVRVRFVDPSPLGLDGKLLSATVGSPFGVVTPVRKSESRDAVEFEAAVPAGAVARFAASYCGVSYVRKIPPDVAAVEIVAQPTGVLAARTSARPLPATFVFEAVGAGERGVAEETSEWRTPRDAAWTLPPFRVPPGRYRVRARLLLEGIGAPVELGEREVDVVAGVRTVVDF
jgi:hypothetical protein